MLVADIDQRRIALNKTGPQQKQICNSFAFAMPRATRAALRAQELADETTTAAAIALPSTPTRERVPLGEISNNKNNITEMAVSEQSAEIERKVGAKGNKGKGGRKGKKGAKAKAEDKEVEILDDDQQSSHSGAVDEACNNLMEAAGVGKLF